MVGEVQQISDSFKKRDIVIIDASGQYAQTILFQATQDRCDLLNSVNVGDVVEVTFFLRGREWTNPKDGSVRYFNTLDMYKCVTTLASGQARQNTPTEGETFVAEGDDDLPF